MIIKDSDNIARHIVILDCKSKSLVNFCKEFNTKTGESILYVVEGGKVKTKWVDNKNTSFKTGGIKEVVFEEKVFEDAIAINTETKQIIK